MTHRVESDSLVGRSVDGYRISGVLGRGGMGIVYEADEIELSRTVAIKVLDPALANNVGFLRRFQREGHALASIDSPHIVRVHTMRKTPAGLFLVMEYVDGGTLLDRIREGPIPWTEALPLIRQTLLALEHAHSVRVTHRDIKPHNILLTSTGQVKVADFGLAKVHEADRSATVTQGISGTLYYMSPEQVKGHADLDHRTDLYSLGMTIYQMVGGRLPFDPDQSEYGIMRSIVDESFPPPSSFNKTLPAEVDAVVMRALAKAPEQRFDSAAAMREAFEAVPSSGRRSDRSSARQAARTGGPSRVRPAVYLAAAAGVVVAAVTAALLWPSPPTLTLDSDPRAAVVLLDGDSVGVTPLTGYALPGGSEGVMLRLQKDGYEPYERWLPLGGGEPLTLGAVALQRATEDAGDAENADALIVLEVDEPGAAVRVNGRPAGLTPLTEPIAVAPGSVRLDVSKNGFETWSGRYDVAAGARQAITATLEPNRPLSSSSPPPEAPPEAPPTSGTLTLRMEPGGGRVEVDGTPCEVAAPCSVPAGRRAVTFAHPDFPPVTRQVEVPAGGSVERTIYLTRTVLVKATKDGAMLSASFQIDGASGDPLFTPREVQLGPGTHRIRATDGYENAVQTVTVEPSFTPPSLHVVEFTF